VLETPLRLLTYLSPGLPFGLYQVVADYLAASLGHEVAVASAPDGSGSGPGPGVPNPFASGEADVGFVCAPSYRWMSRGASPTVELLGAAPCHDDPRCEGRPVYFAEVVTRKDAGPTRFEELDGARVVYNDPASLSGYHCLLGALDERSLRAESFFSTFEPSGSHHRSLELIIEGRADAAAIDANVLNAARSLGLPLPISTVCTLGPFPIQPIVVRRGLGPIRIAIRDALLEMHLTAEGAPLRRYGVERFALVDAAHYASVMGC